MSENSNDMYSALADRGDFVQDTALRNTSNTRNTGSAGDVGVSDGKVSFSAALEEFKKSPEFERMLDGWLQESLVTGKSLDATPFFGELMKSVLEKGLQAEMVSHLG